MNVTRVILYPLPPPTCNNLDTKQRNRLLRSTRKLGAVLGTTPRLAESHPNAPQPIPVALLPVGAITSKSSRPGTPESTKSGRPRQGSVFTCTPSSPELLYTSSSTNSSVASLSLSLSSLPHPHSRTTSEARSPAHPTYSHSRSKSSAHAHGKPRRAGEHLPPPLVLRLNATPTATPVRPSSLPPTPSSTTLTTSSSGLTSPGTPPDTPLRTPLTPVFPSAAETRRKRMAKLARTLGENVPPSLVFPSTKAGAGALPVREVKARKRRSMSADFGAQVVAPAHASQSSRVWVTGPGNDRWMGQWNRRDIREVQSQLRALKAR